MVTWWWMQGRGEAGSQQLKGTSSFLYSDSVGALLKHEKAGAEKTAIMLFKI